MQQKLASNGKENWFEFPIFIGGGGTDSCDVSVGIQKIAHLLCMV